MLRQEEPQQEIGQELTINDQALNVQQDIGQDERSPQETTLTRVALFEQNDKVQDPTNAWIKHMQLERKER